MERGGISTDNTCLEIPVEGGGGRGGRRQGGGRGGRDGGAAPVVGAGGRGGSRRSRPRRNTHHLSTLPLLFPLRYIEWRRIITINYTVHNTQKVTADDER